MKLEGITVYDQEAGVFFSYVKQFPAICAQGKTLNETHHKLSSYFGSYIDRIKSQNIEMGKVETI